jgi:hypothetical protein
MVQQPAQNALGDYTMDADQAPTEQSAPAAPVTQIEQVVPLAPIEQVAEAVPTAPMEEAVPLEQIAKATPLASNTRLGLHAQKAIKLVGDFDNAPDAITQFYDLGELEEHLEEFKKLIENERATLKLQRNQEVRDAFEQFLLDKDIGSAEELWTILGIDLSPSVQDKVTNAPGKKTSNADPFQKVNNWLYREEHNGGQVDFAKGFVNGIQGMPKQDWHKRVGKSIDWSFYREATDAEKAQMAAIRNAQLEEARKAAPSPKS